MLIICVRLLNNILKFNQPKGSFQNAIHDSCFLQSIIPILTAKYVIEKNRLEIVF